MVDLEPLFEAPFEVLLRLGVALLAVVAVVGRSPATTAIVALYLLTVPGYLAYRIRAWERDDEAGDDGD
ncbi:hypothetical protein [Natronococcus wangiae]|uniref:hypothetical protein n=1 Tax=Natronococcus wangiae TaxID=3068275 RepID=UPI0027402C0D|nr:hypothetical protein [Natronococcus sp. AD5]